MRADNINSMKTSQDVSGAPALIVRWIHGKKEKDEIAARAKLRAPTVQGQKTFAPANAHGTADPSFAKPTYHY